jgi:hypothetical protein
MSAEIRIQLSKNSVRLRPGERADLTLTVQNMGEIVDRYHITVQGADPSRRGRTRSRSPWDFPRARRLGPAATSSPCR